jgi:2-aminoadipate transaminase
MGNSVSRIASLYSERAKAGVGRLTGGPTYPIRINFDQGLPDPRYFPVELLRTFIEATFDEDGSDALKYFGRGGGEEMLQGWIGLREELAAWIGRRDGRSLDATNVLLVNGSTDGLALAVNGYLGPGDGAIVEAATYPPTRNFMQLTGATIRTVPLDEHGMVVDELPAALAGLQAEGARPKLVYTIPTFHAPTGTVLPLERRRRLLEVAEEWGVLVLEDNCYYEFAYDEPAPPTLLALDRSGLVLQSDSFSKYLAPGVRMAWAAGAPEALEGMIRVRQDFAVSQLLARALARYVAAGVLDAHVAELRDVYRRKRDVTAAALEAHCLPWVRYRVPSGGFYFWLEISPDVDWDVARTRLAEEGVAFRPGDAYVGDPQGRRFVRISSIQVPEDDIETGIAAMAAALAAASRAPAGSSWGHAER